MTVTYTGKVANARIGAFSRLLLYWRGSVYKLMYKEMMIFITIYTVFSLLYRFALNGWKKRLFERICLYCETYTNLIPVSFVLGFYVSIVVARWWNQFMNIPWPDRVMMYVVTLVEGLDERSRMIRRTLMRYLTLGSLLVFQATSVSVKKRFPTMDHLIEAGSSSEPKRCVMQLSWGCSTTVHYLHPMLLHLYRLSPPSKMPHTHIAEISHGRH